MPTNPANKVKFGLSNVHYAPLTVGADGALGPITGPMVPMALEGIPSGDGTLECTVCMFSGRRSGMAGIHDGIARRTIHDAGGYRLCFDLVGSSLL